MCSRGGDWSYGFVLHDTWLAGANFPQMLAPAGSNFFVNAIGGYSVTTSDYEYIAYGNSASGPYATSTLNTGWNVDLDDNFVIGEKGELVTVVFDTSANNYKVYIDNVLKVNTSNSVYFFMPNDTSNNVFHFGDIGDVNGYTAHPDPYDEVSGWPYNLDSIFVANRIAFDSTAVADLVNHKNDLSSCSNASNLTMLAEFTSGGATIVQGDASLTTRTIIFS